MRRSTQLISVILKLRISFMFKHFPIHISREIKDFGREVFDGDLKRISRDSLGYFLRG